MIGLVEKRSEDPRDERNGLKIQRAGLKRGSISRARRNDHHYGSDCLPRFSLQDLNLKLISDELMIEKRKELFKAMQSMFEKYHQREPAANLNTHTLEPSRRFNSICYDDDDDYDYEESTIPLNEIISQIPLSIVITTSTPVLPIEDPKVSLIMGNKKLSTISETESDEGFIDEPPLEENDDLFDFESKENKWKKILYDAPIDDLMTEDKIFDLGIHDQIFSPTYVNLPFEDRHYLFFTYVVTDMSKIDKIKGKTDKPSTEMECARKNPKLNPNLS
nr:hypothetical protein [Tanacetum cinerariifolium]